MIFTYWIHFPNLPYLIRFQNSPHQNHLQILIPCQQGSLPLAPCPQAPPPPALPHTGPGSTWSHQSRTEAHHQNLSSHTHRDCYNGGVENGMAAYRHSCIHRPSWDPCCPRSSSLDSIQCPFLPCHRIHSYLPFHHIHSYLPFHPFLHVHSYLPFCFPYHAVQKPGLVKQR